MRILMLRVYQKASENTRKVSEYNRIHQICQVDQRVAEDAGMIRRVRVHPHLFELGAILQVSQKKASVFCRIRNLLDI